LAFAENVDSDIKKEEMIRANFRHRLRHRFGREWQRIKPDIKIKKIAIVGSPNVGKSVLFNALTKKYVTVSNYPGTTVEVARGKTRIGGEDYEVIDTPGMYSLLPLTEEERVARRILIKGKPDFVIHVVDAKNLERMLSLTLQLIEASLSTILVLNIMDEAQKEGIKIDTNLLEKELGIPVIEAVSTTGKGIDDLKKRIANYEKRI
jgi:ferrous iron transport protein B